MAFTIFFTIIFEFTFISDKKNKKVRNKKKKKKEKQEIQQRRQCFCPLNTHVYFSYFSQSCGVTKDIKISKLFNAFPFDRILCLTLVTFQVGEPSLL